MANKKALFLTLVDHIPRFEHIKASFRQIQLIRCAYESLRCLGLNTIWQFCAHDDNNTTDYFTPLRMCTG